MFIFEIDCKHSETQRSLWPHRCPLGLRQKGSTTLKTAMRACGSNDSVALLLEDPEGARPHGEQVSLLVVDPPLGGRRTPSPVHDLAPARDAPLPDRTQEVHVHLHRRSANTYQGGDREPHRVVYKRGVDAAVQRPVAVKVYLLDVYV